MKTLPVHISEFLTYLSIERDASPLTIRDYAHYLKVFSDWYAANYPDKTIEDLSMQIISSFRMYLSQKSYREKVISKCTQNYYVICLRSFLKFLLKNRDFDIFLINQ
jgi:site-specific recombinase XerD